MSNIFDLVEEKKLACSGINAEVYRHKDFGSKHIHLKSESDEKSFLVAEQYPRIRVGLLTYLSILYCVVQKRFPVRDPFFMMIRRSLALL